MEDDSCDVIPDEDNKVARGITVSSPHLFIGEASPLKIEKEKSSGSENVVMSPEVKKK